jgi:outer membrane lipoprotein SlyB
MKRLVATLMLFAVFTAATAEPAAACAAHRRHARTAYATQRARYASSRRAAYYDYAPHRRTFWQKHRDKLTVAGGTLGGAAIGGLVGGHKGAAIGALAGGGGSALYTYKVRKRSRRY